jgi:serine/threonine-protein kinase RsbW
MRVADELSIRVAAEERRVAVVRRAISAFARALGMDEQGIGELSTAVTEACDNTVLHAYGSSSRGALDVTAVQETQDLSVRVRDFGAGLQPQVDDPAGEHLRIGLALMSTLADRFQVRSGPGFGTEVSLRFDLAGARSVEDDFRPDWPPPAVQLIVHGSAASQAVRPVLTILAAQEGFSVDRISDLQLIGDLLARGLADLDGNGTILRVDWEGDAFRVSVGPLPDGLGRDLLQVSEAQGLKRLADDVELEARDGQDTVRIQVGRTAPQRPAAGQ